MSKNSYEDLEIICLCKYVVPDPPEYENYTII